MKWHAGCGSLPETVSDMLMRLKMVPHWLLTNSDNLSTGHEPHFAFVLSLKLNWHLVRQLCTAFEVQVLQWKCMKIAHNFSDSGGTHYWQKKSCNQIKVIMLKYYSWALSCGLYAFMSSSCWVQWASWKYSSNKFGKCIIEKCFL